MHIYLVQSICEYSLVSFTRKINLIKKTCILKQRATLCSKSPGLSEAEMIYIDLFLYKLL